MRSCSNEYYIWLLNKVTSRDINDYTEMLRYLFDTEFYSPHERDIDRARDGTYLREEYKYYTKKDPGIEGQARMLEVMVALACRLEREYLALANQPDYSYKWFWFMFYNMGFVSLDDDVFDEQSASEYVNRVLSKDVEERNGSLLYSWFPVSLELARTTVIWRCAMQWVIDIHHKT